MGWRAEIGVEVPPVITLDTMYVMTQEIVDELNSKNECKLRVRMTPHYLIVDLI